MIFFTILKIKIRKVFMKNLLILLCLLGLVDFWMNLCGHHYGCTEQLENNYILAELNFSFRTWCYEFFYNISNHLCSHFCTRNFYISKAKLFYNYGYYVHTHLSLMLVCYNCPIVFKLSIYKAQLLKLYFLTFNSRVQMSCQIFHGITKP